MNTLRSGFWFVVVLAGASFDAWAADGVVAPVVVHRAEAFDPAEVHLLPGPFAHAQELDTEYLLRLEPDRLLSWFRKEAGLAPRAEAYGGWERMGVAGHSLGHYLSACAWMFRTTRDERFRKRVEATVAELAACQEANGNGYVAAIPRGKEVFAEVARGDIRSQGFDLNGSWVPWYTLHKLLAGLRDASVFCDDARARAVMLRLCDWVVDLTRGLDDAQWQRMLACEHGGMNEVLADAYAFSGDRKYLECALKFRHRAVLDALEGRRDELSGKHANTQIPKLIGAARIHELTGDPAFGTMSEFFWQTVVRHHSYVTGGNSLREHFGPPDHLNDRLGDETTETCNTYNMLRLTKALFQREPRAEYMDFAERALWNHILASQNPADGMVCYFVPLRTGGHKRFMSPFDDFTCCTGTGMENHARYVESLFFHSADTLFVNQFIPSVVAWREKELQVRLTSDLPRSGKVRLALQCNRPVAVRLQVRHPRWAAGAPRVWVNGSRRKVQSVPGSYLSLADVWRDGDAVEIDWPIALRTESMPDNPSRVAVFWGPVLLAGDLGPESQESATPALVTDGRSVERWLQRLPGEPVRFRTRKAAKPADVTLQPFYEVHGRRHVVYWDLFTSAGWKRKETEVRRQEAERKALEARTVDSLSVGEMQPERDHQLEGDKTAAGEALGRKWRHATDGGWFGFQMRVLPTRSMDLVVTYWGSDGGGNRAFDILVDSRKVATQVLERNQPDQFIDVVYPLPSDLTQGKDRVTVRFQAQPGKWAGGVFGVRMLQRDPPGR